MKKKPKTTIHKGVKYKKPLPIKYDENPPPLMLYGRSPNDWAKYAFDHWLHSGEKDPSKLLENKMLEGVFLIAMTEERNRVIDEVVALLALIGNPLPNEITRKLQILKGTKNVWKR